MTPAQPTHPLEAWLLDHAHETPPESVLRATNLAAYAYAALPPKHPARPALLPDYLAALARHERIKRELVSLIGRWNAAGIEPLLFKGFYLAEFVYPAPGMRFHGDADLVVKPEQATAASAIAQSAGWTEDDNSALMGQPYKHSTCSLYGPEGAACVDLHRLVLHCELPWDRVQRRVTGAVWALSEPLEWEGTRIRVPSPVDAALVGLVLQRCWGDRWHLKPHDVLDLRSLSERLGVARDALRC
ncbi:MAG TPA: nucleotidyltransferase family protein, partial [Gemmatimonadaceae bacterium]